MRTNGLFLLIKQANGAVNHYVLDSESLAPALRIGYNGASYLAHDLFWENGAMTEPAKKDRSFVGRVTSIALGTASLAVDAVDKTVDTAVDVTKGAVHVADVVTAPIRAPLDAIGVTNLVTAPIDFVTDQVAETADSLADKGQEAMVSTMGFVAAPVAAVVDSVLLYLSNNPQADALVMDQINKALPSLATNPSVQALVRSQVEQVMPYLMENAAVQELIRAQAHAYLGYLEEHPEEVEELVRLVGDNYIDYLNQYPAAVQSLIQGQSIGLAAEMRDEVRERTVTGDSVVDMVVRHLLRLTPADELPSPSEPVKRRAEYGRLPEDYIRKYPNDQD